jgi:uncharacterized membrane protein YdbT with pleckstrin-like domain
MLNLEKDEKVIRVVRKHWFAIVIQMAVSVILIFAPIIFFGIFESFIAINPTTKNLFLFLFIYVVFLIFVWIFIFVSWLDYYLDVWVITNKRIIDIDQQGLFNREIASLRLDNVQDIKIEVFGIINTLLKIGNLHVQTASPNKEFILYQANRPEEVKRLIMHANKIETEKVQVVKIQD